LSKPLSNASDDFQPTACWANLRLRARLLRRLREFFDSRGFLEVETPLLSADIVVDRHLEPFDVGAAPASKIAASKIDSPADAAGADARRWWLQTSPEFAMKRLLAAGGKAIYQVTHAFRRGERGRLHNPEFTIVEWYRTGDSMAEGVELLSRLCQSLLDLPEADRLSYREAFLRFADMDPFEVSIAGLQAVAGQRGLAVPEGSDREDRGGWLDLLLVECVEPHLGFKRPTILYDYPASQAALARIRREEPPVAERFELYVDGIELANGYHELVDAEELRRRNRQVNARRRADGHRVLPEESRLLAAMDAGLPASTGVALGWDRLVMIAAGATRIDQVMPFPVERA